jgi:hypothetical protein
MQKLGKIYLNGHKGNVPTAVKELETLLAQARLCEGRVTVKIEWKG